MTAPVAGWYPAPDHQPYERWWTGSAWAEQTRPLQVAALPTTMVTYQPNRTSHTFHLIMSLLTAGVWAVLVWLPLTVIHSVTRRKVVTRLR